MGQKWESASYQSIVTHINCQPNEILFLTDVELSKITEEEEERRNAVNEELWRVK
jgi:methionine salvage enolase-phosphatase E1